MGTPFRGHVTPAGTPKRPYDSRQHAIASLRRRGGTGEIYQCELCRRWHVSTGRVSGLDWRADDDRLI